MSPRFPETRRGDVVETLHGTEVADPYRWLEDPDSDETADWVRRQNAATAEHLAGLPDRDWFVATLDAVVHRPRAGVPRSRAGHVFVNRNDGRQPQDVWYVADDLEGLRAGGAVVLDPNTFSADGSDSLGGFTVSRDGATVAYGVSEGGSDWLGFRLLDLATGRPVDDAPIQTKFSLPVWLPDHASYLYTGYPRDGHADGTQVGAVGAPQLRRHRVGTAEADDEVLLEFPDDDELVFWAELSHDRRWVVVTVVKGTESHTRLVLFPVGSPDGTEAATLGDPVWLVGEPVAEFVFLRTIENDGGPAVLLQTDLDAPRGRVVRCPIVAGDPVPPLTTVLAEGEATLSSVVAAGDALLTETLVDAVSRLDVWSLSGEHRGQLDLGGGALTEISGDPDDPVAYVGVSTVTTRTLAFAVDTAGRAGEVVAEPLPDLIPADAGGWTPPEVVTERRRARSADGTEVPYFLLRRDDLDLDRPRPTLLYGYGGFKIPIQASYRDAWPAWLAAGGVLAIANLRGGGEYGSGWYDAGRRAAKQNVFDDFVAVGEDLVATGVTDHDRLALHGASNGGLLVGAVLAQRPDLAAVALPQVGVLDLLRFHLFTYGRAWISDYGDPDDPAEFAVALAYSPVHNVREQTDYPATLVLTGDHDDRVVPLHSHKFTATLQRAQAGDAPVLTRIEVATGHGAGKPLDKVAAETADLLAFAAHHTGLHPEN